MVPNSRSLPILAYYSLSRHNSPRARSRNRRRPLRRSRATKYSSRTISTSYSTMVAKQMATDLRRRPGNAPCRARCHRAVLLKRLVSPLPTMNVKLLSFKQPSARTGVVDLLHHFQQCFGAAASKIAQLRNTDFQHNLPHTQQDPFKEQYKETKPVS